MPGWNDELPWIGQYMLDAKGNPMPATGLLSWGRWLETAERHVALTQFAWGAVSTVFLGLDQSFFFGPEDDPLGYKPVLWETMVFVHHSRKNAALVKELDLEQRRYTSREDALKGHAEMVERCKKVAQKPEDRICMDTVSGAEVQKG